ncbi:MAG: MFS transporter [Caldilineaceae bacterium]
MHLARKVDRQLLAPKAFYFLFYAAGAALFPYLVLYYNGVGLHTSQIGILLAIGPLVTLIAAPVWGGIADYTHRHKLVMFVAVVGAMSMVAAISQTSAFWALVPVVLVYAWFSAPIVPLADNAVLSLLGSRSDEYGKQRMWGAVGWGISGLLAGIAIDVYGQSYSFVGYIFFLGFGLIAISRIPLSEGSVSTPFWSGLKILARNARWLYFLMAMLLTGIGYGVNFQFLFLYLDSLGASGTLMGWTLMIATISEVPIFFYSDYLLLKLGASGLMLVSMFVSTLRLLAYALMPNAWYALALAAFHGLSFSARWAAGVSYSNREAPPGLGATAQGLFTGASMGLGTAGGALLGGVLFDTWGPRAAFASAAAVAACGMAIFIVSEMAFGKKMAYR